MNDLAKLEELRQQFETVDERSRRIAEDLVKAHEELLRKAEMDLLHSHLMGLKVKQGVTDGWKLDWLEAHPGELTGVVINEVKTWIYQGKSFTSARAAIDYAIGLVYPVPVA